ncbi:YPDG domain-containing protein, partial [Mammaliicoccus sciuri]|uniref:YPDG domain-containing protein n=1 Tax=Mammaliicoccus sciuri TaxID=1296 RepID=UPI001FB4B75B
MDKQRKLQKFSIRKYTVGTCSILIGTLIFLGLPTHDAFASENVIQKHAQEEKAEGKSTDPVEEASAVEESSNVEETKEIGTVETPAEQPQEEATTEAPAVDETTQDTTTNEESTTEDKSTTEEASTEEATQVDTVAPEAAKVETAEKAEQPKAESTEVAKEETTTEETAETAEPAVNTVDAVQPASVEETPAVDTPTVEATVTNTISDVDTSSVSSKSLEDIVNDQNKDKVEATTLEQPSRQAPKSGASYGSVFRAAELATREVNNFKEFFAALNDRNVGNIVFNSNIAMDNAAYLGAAHNVKTNKSVLQQNAARSVNINLNGHEFYTRDNFLEIPANGKSQPAWNITFDNGTIRTDDNGPRPLMDENIGIIKYDDGAHDQVLNFKNITHLGSTLINAKKVKINIYEELTSHNEGKRGSDKNITIGGNFIRISANSTINMDMTTKGKIFKVYGNEDLNKAKDFFNGNLSFESGSKVTLNTLSDNPWDEDNAHTIFYAEGEGVRIILGNDNTFDLKGQNIFQFKDDNGMLNTGQRTKIDIEQKGNGNIIDMRSRSRFNVEQDATFNAVSKFKLNGGPRANNLFGFNSNSIATIMDNAVFKVDARNHKISENGEKGDHNPVFSMVTSNATLSKLILKPNSTFDIKSDVPDEHSELVGFANQGGGEEERGIFMEGTVKYFNLQRTGIVSGGDAGSYYKPTGNVVLMYGEPGKKNMLKWSPVKKSDKEGDHEVRTWDARQFSGKGHYDSDIDSNVSQIWKSIVGYSSRQANKHTDMSSIKLNEERSTLVSNRGLSIKELDLGKNQRFLLIGNTDARKNDPNYGEEFKATSPGTAITVDQIGDTDLPEGTTFEIPTGNLIPEGTAIPEGWTVTVENTGENKGKVTVTPTADAEINKEAKIPVRITYPDGSVDTTYVPIKIKDFDNNLNDPGYGTDPTETKPGLPAEVSITTPENQPLPENTTFKIAENATLPTGWTISVDENGKVTATPPADAETDRTYDIPVEVTYPDKSKDTATAKVKVVP